MRGKIKSGKRVGRSADYSVSVASNLLFCCLTSTEIEKRLVVKSVAVSVYFSFSVVFERNSLNVFEIEERTVFNESYCLRNSKSSCGVLGRTVEESSGNTVAVGCLVKNAVDRNVVVVFAGSNGDSLKSGASCEELGHITNVDHALERGVVVSVNLAVKMSCSCGEVDGGKTGALFEYAYTKRKSFSSFSKADGGKRSHGGECIVADRRDVSGNSKACNLGRLECAGFDLGYVRTEDVGSARNTCACEGVASNVGSSVLKINRLKLGAVLECTLSAGVNKREERVAFFYGYGCKVRARLECTCADRSYVCGNVDRSKSSVAGECINTYLSQRCGHCEGRELRRLECCITDNGCVSGNCCRSEFITSGECVLTDSKSCICISTGLVSKSSKCGTVLECAFTDSGYALLDLEGCKSGVT